jgi:hypothetical protein
MAGKGKGEREKGEAIEIADCGADYAAAWEKLSRNNAAKSGQRSGLLASNDRPQLPEYQKLAGEWRGE